MTNKKKEIQDQLDDEEDLPIPMCRVWDSCFHPELCQEKCRDKDLEKSWGITGVEYKEDP